MSQKTKGLQALFCVSVSRPELLCTTFPATSQKSKLVPAKRLQVPLNQPLPNQSSLVQPRRSTSAPRRVPSAFIVANALRDIHLPVRKLSGSSFVGVLGCGSCWDIASPQASHIKASHPHCPRFRVRIFRVFALWNLLRPLFFWGERDLNFPHFPHFPRIGFESLISNIRLTGFIMTGLR